MRTSGNLQQKTRSVLFTGGGTGGHVYPGIAVYEAMMEKAVAKGLPIHGTWIGSRGGMERGILGLREIPYIGIPSGKLRRYFSISNVIDLFKVAAGIAAAYFVMKRKRPRVLFSKGGYVSVPPVIAARFAGVPVITHESDYDPGLATRINSRFAQKVLVSFEETRNFFGDSLKSRILVTGNPVRPEVPAGKAGLGNTYLAFESEKPVLLILGGSQGAREINELIWRAYPNLLEHWNVVHQTGRDKSGPPAGKGYRRYEYIHDEYGDILAAANLVLCRAGATTLWELAASKKPSILLPLGTVASRGDQIRNAALFEKLGASFVLPGGSGNESELLNYMDTLIAEPEVLTGMGDAAASIYRPEAASKIAEMLLEYTNKEV